MNILEKELRLIKSSVLQFFQDTISEPAVSQEVLHAGWPFGGEGLGSS
jgi:hypothetical protein